MGWERAEAFAMLHCAHASGKQQVFEVRSEGAYDGTRTSWLFYARPHPNDHSEQREFFASVVEVSTNMWQLDFMSNNLSEAYKGFGIARALIPQIASRFRRGISSSRAASLESETRSAAATRVWRRMVNDGTASYSSSEDRFYHPAERL
jgi:hypothetical protein